MSDTNRYNFGKLLIRQFSALTAGGKPGFSYRIKGSLSVAGGIRIPFDRGGQFDFGPGRAR